VDGIDQQRQRLLNEKRQRQTMREQEKREKERMDEKVGMAMRKGDLIEAHKLAMQKMQAGVGK